MKNSKIMVAICSGMLALALHANGQTVYQLKIKGVCQTTNDSGDLVSLKLNNETFIQDAVMATGATNSSSLDLVYVQDASTDPSAHGDFIEVYDKTTGSAVYTNLQFMYNSPFPPALTNAAGDMVVIGAQVIPLPLAGSGDSLGGATITERFLRKKTLVRGTFNYTVLRSPGSNINDTVRACSGSFSVNKLYTLP